MTDDLHPDLELASRALDEDLTEEERARVQASAELTGLVASLRSTRDAVAEVPPASAQTRHDALAGALAVFDDLQATATDEAPTTTAAHRPGGNVVALFRRRASWVMAAAAAVLVVGVVGTLAVNSGSDDSASISTEAGDEIFRSAADTAAEDAAGATEMTGAATQSTISSINSPAVAGIVVDDPAGLLALADELAPMAMTTAGSADSLPIVPDASNPDDGAAGGGAATVPKDRIDCPLSPDQVVFADILWQETPAVAVRSTTTGVVQAVSYDCIVLVTVGP